MGAINKRGLIPKGNATTKRRTRQPGPDRLGNLGDSNWPRILALGTIWQCDRDHQQSCEQKNSGPKPLFCTCNYLQPTSYGP
jgi:hypothetical protein